MKIGIDLNYRSIEGVLLDDDNIIKSIDKSLNSESICSKKSKMNLMHSIINELINPEVTGIGISLPSVIDAEKGVIYNLSQIPHWKGMRIQRIIQETYLVPVFVNNDVNCMVLGEKHYGSGKGFYDILCINLDDNLGVGSMVNNQLSMYSHKTFEKLNVYRNRIIKPYENTGKAI